MLSRIASASTLCLVALLAAGSPSARADEIDDSIAKLMAAAKKGEERDSIKWMDALKDKTDSRVGAAFVKLTSNKNEKIAVIAYQKAAARKEPALLKKLPGLIKNRKIAKKKPAIYVAILKAAGEYGSKKTRDHLIKVVKKYMPTNPKYSVPAILSFGREREVENIETLLDWATMSTPSTGGSGASLSQETRDNLAKAGTAVYDALADLTGQDIRDVSTWKDWWEENEKGYELPDPNKVEEPVDFSKLREHTDPTYHYTVKIPGEAKTEEQIAEGDNTGWTLADPDEGIVGGRFQARYMSKSEQVVRIHYVIFNTSGQTQKTPELFVEWWIGDWKENHFDQETMKPKEPEPQAIKIGGRDFVWAECVGVSAGRSRSWGPCYRRIYVTQMRHLLLYIYVDMKTGAEDDIRKQTKDIVEKMTFKKK